MANAIRFFGKDSPYAALSNFAPHGFVEDSLRWPTVEHYFQAQKFDDAAYRERIRAAASPMQAKALGQSRAIPIRPDWDTVREDVMRRALRCKFAAPELRALLLGTKRRELIEDSPYDRYWGAGRDGKGKNRLGHLLMELREELSAATSPAAE